MAYDKKINDMKILFVMLIGIPLIASTNIDCGGKSFHCLNSTHFMICVDLGGGVSYTVDDFVIECPPPTVCSRNNLYECEFVITTTTTTTTTTTKPTTVLQSSVTAEKVIVDTPAWITGPEQHMELSTVINTQKTTTDASVLPLSTDATLDLNTNGTEGGILITTEPANGTTIMDPNIINPVTESATVPSTDKILITADTTSDNITKFMDIESSSNVSTNDFTISDKLSDNSNKIATIESVIKIENNTNVTDENIVNNSEKGSSYTKNPSSIDANAVSNTTNKSIVIVQDTRASSLSERSISTTETNAEIEVFSITTGNYDATTEMIVTNTPFTETEGTRISISPVSAAEGNVVTDIIYTGDFGTFSTTTGLSKLNTSITDKLFSQINTTVSNTGDLGATTDNTVLNKTGSEYLANNSSISVDFTAASTDEPAVDSTAATKAETEVMSYDPTTVMTVTNTPFIEIEGTTISSNTISAQEGNIVTKPTQVTENILSTTKSSQLNTSTTDKLSSQLNTTVSNSTDLGATTENTVLNETVNQNLANSSSVSVDFTPASTVSSYRKEENTATDVGTTPSTVSIYLNTTTGNSTQTSAPFFVISNNTDSEYTDTTTKPTKNISIEWDMIAADKNNNTMVTETTNLVVTTTPTTDYLSPSLIYTEILFDTSISNNTMDVQSITTESLRTTIDTMITTTQATILPTDADALNVLWDHKFTTEIPGLATTTPTVHNSTATENKTTKETLGLVDVFEINTEETMFLNITENVGSFNKSEPIVLIDDIDSPQAVVQQTNSPDTTKTSDTDQIEPQANTVQSRFDPNITKTIIENSTAASTAPQVNTTVSEIQTDTEQTSAAVLVESQYTNAQSNYSSFISPIHIAQSNDKELLQNTKVTTVQSVVAHTETPVNTGQNISTQTEIQGVTVPKYFDIKDIITQTTTVPNDTAANTKQSTVLPNKANAGQDTVAHNISDNPLNNSTGLNLANIKKNTATVNQSQVNTDQNTSVSTTYNEISTTSLPEPQVNTEKIQISEADPKHSIAGLNKIQTNTDQSINAVTEYQDNTNQITTIPDSIVQITTATTESSAFLEHSYTGPTANTEQSVYTVTTGIPTIADLPIYTEQIIELPTPQTYSKIDIAVTTAPAPSENNYEKTGPQYATNQGIYEQTTLQTVPKIDNKGTTKSLATSKTGFETAQTEDLRPSFQSTAPDMPVVQATSQQDLIATRGPSTQDLTASQATQGASDLTAAKDTQDLTEAQATQGSSDLNATHATQDPTTAQATQGSSDLNAAHATQDFIAAQATQSSSDLNAAHATQDLTASQATQGASDLTATQGTSDLTAAQGASDLTAAQATQGASDLTATQSASDLTVTQAIQGASDLTAVQVTQGASDLTATQSASDLTVTQATQGASDLTAVQVTQGASDLTAAQATQGASDLTASQATQGASDLTAAQATQSASHLTVTQGTTNLNAAQGASDLPVTQGASYLTAAQATQGASDLTVAQGASDLTAAQATPGASDLTAARGASDLTAAQTTQSASNVIVAQAAITDLITTQTLPQQGVTEQNKPEFTSEQSNIETTGLQATSQLAIAQKTEPSQQSHIGTIPGPQTVHSVQNVNETQSKQSTTQQDGTKNEHRNQSVPTATATQANHKLPQVIAPAESHSTTANKNIAVSKGHNIPEKVDSLINIITSPGLLTNSSGNTLKTDEENTILSSTQLSISKQNVSQTKPEHSKTNISQGGITNSDSDKYNEFLQNHVTVQTGSPVNADSVAINTIQREKNNSLTNIPSSVLHIQNGTVTISQEHQDSTSVLSSTKSVISDDWLVFKTTVSPSSNSENARTLEYTKLTSGNPKDIEITDRDINQMPKSNNDITTVSTSTSQDNVPIVTLMDSSNTVTSATITGKDVLFTNSALSANANTETVTEALFYDNKDYNIVPITTLNTVTNQKNSYASDNNKVIQDQIQNGVLSTTTPALIYNIRSPDITPTLPAMYTTKMPFNSYVPILTTTTKYTDKEETTVTTTTEGSTTSSTTINNLNVPQFECEGRPSGRYADNDDCSKFYICSGTSQTIVGSCPVNTVFSDIKKQCTRNLSHCIRNNEFKCTAAGRFADYLKPNVYYICITKDDSFLRYKLQCQNGYLLNRLTVTCYNNFEKPSSQSSSTTTTTSRTTTVKLPQENKVKRTRKEKEVDDFECEEEGKFADPNNCRGYYICKLKNRSEETYRRKYRKCDSDEVFHREKKRCVDADSSYECRYCDALTPNVYYIQIMKGDHFITYKLACRKDYHLNKKKVMCERFLQSEKKPESPEPSQPKEISKKSSEDVSEKEYDSDRSERQDSFECEEEGKFTDPNDCRRYYLCKEKSSSDSERTFRRKQKECGRHRVFSQEKQKCVYSRNDRCL